MRQYARCGQPVKDYPAAVAQSVEVFDRAAQRQVAEIVETVLPSSALIRRHAPSGEVTDEASKFFLENCLI